MDDKESCARLTLWAERRRQMAERAALVHTEFDAKITAAESVEKAESGAATQQTQLQQLQQLLQQQQQQQPSPEEEVAAASAIGKRSAPGLCVWHCSPWNGGGAEEDGGGRCVCGGVCV